MVEKVKKSTCGNNSFDEELKSQMLSGKEKK